MVEDSAHPYSTVNGSDMSNHAQQLLYNGTILACVMIGNSAHPHSSVSGNDISKRVQQLLYNGTIS